MQRRNKTISVRLAALCALCCASVPGAWAQQPVEGRVERDIDYVGDSVVGHLLDIHYPASGEGPYRPVVAIYGSAWFANDAKDYAAAQLAQPLLDAGFAVVTVNHRGSPEAKWPAQIHDIKAAVRYIRGNAERYRLDPEWIGVTGFSSGGHLSALAGVTNRVKEMTVGSVTLDIEGDLGEYTHCSSDVQAVVDWFGPVDMFHMSDDCSGFKGGDSPEAVLIDGVPGEHPEMVALISAATYLDSSDPNFLVIHGDADSVVPYCQSANFAEQLHKHRKLSGFITVEGGEHGPVTFCDSTYQAMVDFFVKEAAYPRDFTSTGDPLVRNKFTADPAPLAVDGRLYLYTGHDEYYPGQDTASGGREFNITEWLCYSTDDMVHWRDHGAVLSPDDFGWAKEAAWAAQCVERDGRYYFYTTSIGNDQYPGYCIGVAVSDTPYGPFRDARGTPLVTDDMTDNGSRGWWNDIDPTVLIDGDDAWLCWGNGTCFLARLKPSMTEIDGDIMVVDVPRYMEGPWLWKDGDTYCLAYAAMGDGSETIEYATAESITGEWTPRGLLMGSAENSFTIHPGIVDFGGERYLFYHNAAQSIDGIPGATGRRSVCFKRLGAAEQ